MPDGDKRNSAEISHVEMYFDEEEESSYGEEVQRQSTCMLSSIPEEMDHPTAMYNLHADGPTLAENSFA